MNHRYLWEQRKIESTRRRKIVLEKLHAKAARIIKNKSTQKKCIDDFPAIHQYIKSKYPTVDVSHISIYLSAPEVIERAWKGIGGCYIDTLKTIFVKTTIGKGDKCDGKFDQLLNDTCEMNATMEDVLVHEIMHAVSYTLNRSSSRFSHMEEEFVYTNCIDFYLQNGKTYDQIIEDILPFCLHDVYNSEEDMRYIILLTPYLPSQIKKMSQSQYTRYLNQYAEILVPAIKIKAQGRARQLFELYNTYGVKMYMDDMVEPNADKTAMRLSALELD